MNEEKIKELLVNRANLYRFKLQNSISEPNLDFGYFMVTVYENLLSFWDKNSNVKNMEFKEFIEIEGYIDVFIGGIRNSLAQNGYVDVTRNFFMRH